MPSRNVVFNQTGMDFVTEISFRLFMIKGWFLEVGSQLGKSFKVSECINHSVYTASNALS